MLDRPLATVFCLLHCHKSEEELLRSRWQYHQGTVQKFVAIDSLPEPKPHQAYFFANCFNRLQPYLALGVPVVLVGRWKEEERKEAIELGYSMFWNLDQESLEDLPLQSLPHLLSKPILLASGDPCLSYPAKTLLAVFGIPSVVATSWEECRLFHDQRLTHGFVWDAETLPYSDLDWSSWGQMTTLPSLILENPNTQGLLSKMQKMGSAPKILIPKKDFLSLLMRSLPWKVSEWQYNRKGYLGNSGSLKVELHPKLGLQNWKLDWENFEDKPSLVSLEKAIEVQRLQKLFDWLVSVK